ncbi:glycosyltransferase family 4 protein [Stratiformator vulcanicus]|uniref:Glycosyltransferase EpsD n=1 Tax=Stratiformator vulcanicus TaxID=2527980 RepID=A0A517QZN5_9PLAN|nr:glycosyltransferase family 4 protein [Stratiformator vulcanicus]QDT37091.1 Putative glycosyltransferase EpsD [Stratiformator vulcanicus]
MPRIAIIFEFPTLFGGERSMLAVIDQLLSPADSSWEFVAICPEQGALRDALSARGIEVKPLNLRDETGKRPPKHIAAEMLHTCLRSVDCDLIHANSLSMARLLGVIATDIALPCTGHLRDILKLNRAAIDDLNRLDRLIAVSDATIEHLAGQGLDRGRVTRIYNGIDRESFRPRPRSFALHDELGHRHDSILLLTVGQIGLRKGHDVTAKAIASIVGGDRRDSGSLGWAIAGERFSAKAESIAFDRSIDEILQAAGLSDRVHRLGYRDDVAKLMNEADLLVHSAHQEPLGRVLLEAAASGLPIIATDVGGTREIFETGIDGELVAADDVVALARAIFARLSTTERLDPPAAFCERFSLKRSAANHADLWRKLITR